MLANRLSANPDCRVLVIEAGGNDSNFWLKLPIGYFRTIYDPRFSRTFETEPGEGDANRGIEWPRGRVVGGTSSINGLVFMRGQHQDFDDWHELGATGWRYRDLLPHFRALETNQQGANRYRGGSGEMQVSGLRNDHPCCRAWLEAAGEYGLPANPDFNQESTYGVGPYQLTLSGRWRASAATCFLHPALNRPNLHLKTDTLVTRVLFDGSNAAGVEWVENGEILNARACREVIVSAGSLQTPQILQLSGIGPAGLLKSLGIPVLVDSPEVGQNLQDHYQMRVMMRLRQPVSLNSDIRNPLKLAQMGMRWLLDASGPLTVGAGQVGGAACTRFADGDRPDIQFNVMPLSVDKPGKPLHPYPGFTAAVWQCHPRSRGSVQIQSRDPTRQARIVPNYFSEDIDRGVIVEGVKILREIHSQASFRKLWDLELVPGDDCSSDADILKRVYSAGGTVFHCVGTSRMGSDEGSVVDPDLRIRGVERLRVVDASVMPGITSANTNAPTLMIAEKGASIILDSLR